MADKHVYTLTDKAKFENEMSERLKLRDSIVQDIATARGFGDLSENAEYDAARKAQGENEGRIAYLKSLLDTAEFVDDTVADTDTAALGTVVRVLETYPGEDSEETEYTIVGVTEIDASKLYISNESAIGRELTNPRINVNRPERRGYGASVGETVYVETPGGTVVMKVLEIKKR